MHDCRTMAETGAARNREYHVLQLPDLKVLQRWVTGSTGLSWGDWALLGRLGSLGVTGLSWGDRALLG